MLRFALSSIPLAIAALGCAPAAVPTFSGDDRVFLLANDEVIHVVTPDGDWRTTTFRAPSGTVSIVHDGTHLLALSRSGVDALDDVTGDVATHVSDVTGKHIATAAGRVVVADGTTVTFLDDGSTIQSASSIDELASYEGALAYENVGDDGNAWFHTLALDGTDVDPGSGTGPGDAVSHRFPPPWAGVDDTKFVLFDVEPTFTGAFPRVSVNDVRIDATGSAVAYWYAIDLHDSSVDVAHLDESQLDVVDIAVKAGAVSDPYPEMASEPAG